MQDGEITGVSYIGAPRSCTAMFITKKVERLLDNLRSAENCLVFAETGIEVPEDLQKKHRFVMSAQPQMEYMAFACEIAAQRAARDSNRKYTLTEGGYYIGENVTIGKDALIEPLCFIGHDVVIGERATILAGSSIRNAIIGDDFIAREHAVIGTTGFTMAEDKDGNKERIPSLGMVRIGNNVEIGSFSSISVGSGNDTVLGNYVKVDTHVEIGHDNLIGDNVELTAGAVLGGFNTIGEKAFLGLNVTTRNRLELGTNCLIGMGAVVTKSVESGETVIGNPARIMQKKDK